MTSAGQPDGRVTVAVMTRDRRDSLDQALRRLESLPDAAPIVVVDNGSSDGTPEMVRERHPRVDLVASDRNLGVAARNLAVELAATPYVAFADDDSWWAAGSLAGAVGVLDEHPEIGLLTATVLVGPDELVDPVSAAMRRSPLGADALPGVPVLGFLACAAVVRREAFLAVGGFEPRLQFFGEEELLALDLAAAGWQLRYVPELVVHHHPSGGRDQAARRQRQLRNALWVAWLRRPPGRALRRSVRLVSDAGPHVPTLRALAEAVRGAGWVRRQRRPLPPTVERDLHALESS